MTHPLWLSRQSIEAEMTSVKKLSQKNFHFPCFQDMLPRLRRLIGLQSRRLVNELSLFKIIKLWKCSWLLPHEKAICFSSLICFSRNTSVQKFEENDFQGPCFCSVLWPGHTIVGDGGINASYQDDGHKSQRQRRKNSEKGQRDDVDNNINDNFHRWPEQSMWSAWCTACLRWSAGATGASSSPPWSRFLLMSLCCCYSW